MIAWADIVAMRAPRTNLLGVELEPFPYSSAFSLLLRVTRLMNLGPGEWFQTLGLRFQAGGPALPDLRLGRVSRARFEAALGLADTSVPTWWAEEIWSPLSTGGLLDRTPRPIRWCWHCAGFGYHSSLFQLPSIRSCPWHVFPLLDHCPQCKRPGTAWIDGQGRLGRCACGHDWLRVDQATVQMRSFPTGLAEAWMTRYLAWAAEQRERRRLVTPPASDRWSDGYAVLAQPSAEFNETASRSWCRGTRDQEFKDGPNADPPETHFWGWSALGDHNPLTYVPLPPLTLATLTQVTQRVIAGLPPDLPRPLELATCSDSDEDATLRENAAPRPEYFIAPHGCAADGSTWLNVSAMDLHTLQACGQLIDSVIEGCDPTPPSTPTSTDLSRQAARAAAIGRVDGRWRLYEALDAILATGYFQGLDALLRTSLELPRSAEWWLPVAEVEGTRGTLARVRVCWVLVPPPRVGQPTPDLSKPLPQKPKSRNRKSARRRGSKRLAPARDRRTS